jgi:flagellar basal-body rod modification protein FlgD
LQAQDPLNPIDPTAFVTQLVQFNQLQQLIDINQTLTQPAAASSSSGTESSASPTSAVQPNSGSASAAIL